MNIFRKEALEYQCVRMSGTVSLRADQRTIRIALMFVALAGCAIAAFLQFQLHLDVPLACRPVPDGRVKVDWPGHRRLPDATVTSLTITVGADSFEFSPKSPLAGSVLAAGLQYRIGAQPPQQCTATAQVRLRLAHLVIAKIFRKPA